MSKKEGASVIMRLPLMADEISIIMRLADVGFRAVAQEAGLGMMNDMTTLKSALDKLQAEYEKQQAGEGD